MGHWPFKELSVFIQRGIPSLCMEPGGIVYLVDFRCFHTGQRGLPLGDKGDFHSFPIGKERIVMLF